MLISRFRRHNCLNGRFHPSPEWVMWALCGEQKRVFTLSADRGWSFGATGGYSSVQTGLAAIRAGGFHQPVAEST